MVSICKIERRALVYAHANCRARNCGIILNSYLVTEYV